MEQGKKFTYEEIRGIVEEVLAALSAGLPGSGSRTVDQDMVTAYLETIDNNLIESMMFGSAGSPFWGASRAWLRACDVFPTPREFALMVEDVAEINRLSDDIRRLQTLNAAYEIELELNKTEQNLARRGICFLDKAMLEALLNRTGEAFALQELEDPSDADIAAGDLLVVGDGLRLLVIKGPDGVGAKEFDLLLKRGARVLRPHPDFRQPASAGGA